MENRLISMTAYLPEHPYSKFLKQPLQKWMFVPCGEDGEVLEEPCLKCADNCDFDKCMEFQQAKERCLFEGFEIIEDIYGKKITDKINVTIALMPNNNTEWIMNCFNTIEDLVKHNLTLTATALKQIEG